jgi:hypothetical protein
VKPTREDLHAWFLEAVEGLQMEPKTWLVFKEVLLDRWSKQHGIAVAACNAAKNRLAELAARKDRLFDMCLDGKIDQDTFDKQQQRIDSDINVVSNQLWDMDETAMENQQDMELLLDFAERILLRNCALSQGSDGVWERGTLETRRRLQSAMFPSGLEVSSEGLEPL